VRPDLGEVERVVRRFFRIYLGHDLHAEFPPREIVPLDSIVKVFLRGFTRPADDLLGLGIGPMLVTLPTWSESLACQSRMSSYPR
jgi:hypothetical protein